MPLIKLKDRSLSAYIYYVLRVGLQQPHQQFLNDWLYLNKTDDDNSFELSDHTWCSFLLQMYTREVNTVICLTSCLKTFAFIFTFPGGEKEPGDVCEQAPEQDQPRGHWARVPVLWRGEHGADLLNLSPSSKKQLITWNTPILSIPYRFFGPGVLVSALWPIGRLLCAPLRLPSNPAGSL